MKRLTKLHELFMTRKSTMPLIQLMQFEWFGVHHHKKWQYCHIIKYFVSQLTGQHTQVYSPNKMKECSIHDTILRSKSERKERLASFQQGLRIDLPPPTICGARSTAQHFSALLCLVENHIDINYRNNWGRHAARHFWFHRRRNHSWCVVYSSR